MATLSGLFNTGSKLVSIEVFAVGGGGGGAGAWSVNGFSGGGGGAGLLVYKSLVHVVAGVSYPISIGAGGAGGPTGVQIASSGGDTILGGVVIAYGGNGGSASTFPLYVSNPTGSVYNTYSFSQGSLGGSLLSVSSDPILTASYAPSTFTENGYVGRNLGGSISQNISPGNTSGAGGGGALSRGTSITVGGPGGIGQIGGNGVYANFIGLTTSYAGGGGGGSPIPNSLGPPIGVDGGGNGAGGSPFLTSVAGTAGAANRGGGGGGGGSGGAFQVGYAGGSGYLFIRYPTAFAAATVTGNAPVTAQPGYNVYGWTSGPGTITFN